MSRDKVKQAEKCRSKGVTKNTRSDKKCKKKRIGRRMNSYGDIDNKKKIKEALSKLPKEQSEIKRLKHGIISAMVRNIVKKLFDAKTPHLTLPAILTRAKSKELMKSQGGTVLWPLSEIIDDTKVSECHDLIKKEFTEDSSEDEEYIPEKSSELDDQVECDVTHENIANDEKTEESPPLSMPLVQDRVKSLDEEIEERIEEAICNRTRSKLPLTDTSLESIQEAFIPPDITKDMYDWGCNDEWSDFLREFERPSKCRNDDVEDDPEFTVYQEEDLVTDQEELRSIKIPRGELDELLDDICLHKAISDIETMDNSYIHEFMESLDMSRDTIESSQASVIQNQNVPVVEEVATESNNNNCNYTTKLAVSVENNGVFTANQLILLRQQIQKHIQLFTQHFLQCYKHPRFSSYANESKKALTHMCYMSACNENSYFHGENLHSCKILISDWEKMNKNESIIVNYTHRLCGKRCKGNEFPREFLKIISESDGILYPSLLPSRPFYCRPLAGTMKRKEELTQPEEMLVAFGIHQFTKIVEGNKSQRQILHEVARYITQYMIANRSSDWLFSYINRRKRSPADNCIKRYYENGELPQIDHNFYLPMKQPLHLQPLKSMPILWARFVNGTYNTPVPGYTTTYRSILPKE